MGAISALSTTSRTLKRNGALFVAALAMTLFNFVPSGVSFVLPPSVAGLLSLPLSALTFLVVPFFLGGLLSMADEATDGTTRLDTFVAGAKEHYLRLLGAMVLFGVLVGIIGAVVTFGVVVLAIFAVGFGATGAGGAAGAGPMAGVGGLSAGVGSLLPVLAFGLVGGLLVLLPVFFLQFYAPAVVVSDLGVVAALKRSAAVVRRNFVSTLGYSAVTALVGLLSAAATLGVSVLAGAGAFSRYGTSPEVGLGLLAGAAVVSTLVVTVVSAFGVVYQVAFYDDCLDPEA